ncbi:MAG: hypothetical protein IJQ47_10155 [Synergistaceae bacterium]|nr:hypothetical protein [Synergistaceae bacterium]
MNGISSLPKFLEGEPLPCGYLEPINPHVDPPLLPETQFTRSEAQAVIDELRAEAAHLPEMTLEEINEEIRAARAQR